MATEFAITWDQAEGRGRFEPVYIHAALVHRKKGVDVALEIESITLDPADVVKLEPDKSRSSETVLVYKCELTPEVLGAKDFYDRIEKPVQVEITAVPIKGDASEGESYKSQCTVRVNVPQPTLHWRGPPNERDDALIEIEADGEHEIELRTWVHRYRPATRDFGYDRQETVFTHKTHPGFSAQLFGPHPADRPVDVAQPTAPEDPKYNNREFSRWISKASLPDPKHSGSMPPVSFSINTRAWPRGAIQRRIPDEVVFKKNPVLEVAIPCVLVPVELVPELLRPERPFPAGDPTERPPHGTPSSIPFEGPFAAPDKSFEGAIKIWRARDHKPLKKGVISWEIKADTSLGGKVHPDQVMLTEADDAEAVFNYTPPQLTYKPNGRYHEDLIVYHGAGADRRQIGSIALLLRPSIKAEIKVKKHGLVCETAGVVDLSPIFSASEMHGKPVFKSENRDPEETAEAPVCLAEVEITCEGTPVHGEIKTDDEGKFIWKLPELDEVFVKLPDERIRDLSDTELPGFRLDKEAEDVITMFEDKVRQFTPFALLDPGLDRGLRVHRLTFGGQIAQKREDSYARIVAATELLRVGATGANSWKATYDPLAARSATDIGNLFSEIAATLVSALNVGDHFANFVSGAAAGLNKYLTGPAFAAIKVVSHELAACLRSAAMRIELIAHSLRGRLPPDLSSMMEKFSAGFKGLVESFYAILYLYPSAARDFLRGMSTWIKNFVSLVFEGLRAFVLLVFWSISKAFQLASDAGGWVLEMASEVWKHTGDASHTLGAPLHDGLYAPWTFAKLLEVLTNLFITKTDKLNTWGGSTASAASLDFFKPYTQDALRLTLDNATSLHVPPSAIRRVDEYNQRFMSMADWQSNVLNTQVTIDVYMGAIDVLLLALELLLAFVIVCNGAIPVLVGSAIGVATIAELSTAIALFEVKLGVAKTVVVRLPQVATTYILTLCTQLQYHASTVALTVPAQP